MPTENLLKKIALYKEELTFDRDKRTIEEWEVTIRGAIVRSEVAQMDGIKDLVKKLKGKVERVNYLLTTDEKLTDEERTKLFIRREDMNWFIGFFDRAEITLNKARKKFKVED